MGKRAGVLAAFLTATVVAQAPPGPSLRSAAAGRFTVGAAVTSDQVRDVAASALVRAQFDTVTPEFELFPQFVHPDPDRFTFERADAVVDFAARHGMPVEGHMLCWHQFTPAWMFQDAAGRPLPRDRALANLKQHIDTVMAHYKGRIKTWDVVNEAVSDAPNEYLRDTPARRAIGDDYVAAAFRFARAADPTATLYYNDYNVEDPQKLPKVLRLVRELRAAGVGPDAVGVQGHWLIDFPPVDVIDRGLTALAAEKVRVRITELDVDPLPRAAGADLNAARPAGDDPYRDGLPDAAADRLAARYGAIFTVFTAHARDIDQVTFWGVHDGQSWLNDFPVKGRTNHPLLFDRQLRPKGAFGAVIEGLQRSSGSKPGKIRE